MILRTKSFSFRSTVTGLAALRRSLRPIGFILCDLDATQRVVTCKYCCHLHCEPKVISSCDPKQSYELNRSESRELRHSRRSKSPGSRSLERTRSPRSLERQLSFAMDVTYVTEKIIVVTFP
ncbi:hypothetical protein MRX96_036798 [Rhipicephalus microplus]